VAGTDEEAVVGKTARVKEEIVVHKEATDRVETVRDTVRRQDVEIERDDSTGRAGGTTPMPSTTTAGPKI
jgi:stress response protein YsnF